MCKSSYIKKKKKKEQAVLKYVPKGYTGSQEPENCSPMLALHAKDSSLPSRSKALIHQRPPTVHPGNLRKRTIHEANERQQADPIVKDLFIDPVKVSARCMDFT